MITVKLDSLKLEQRLDSMHVKAQNLSSPLAGISRTLLTSTQGRFDSETSPNGTKWQPLSPAYKKYKEKVRPGKPILTFNGKLRSSFQTTVTANAVTISNDTPYGRKHQYGKGYTPARPFMGINDNDSQQILKIVREWFKL